MKAKTINAVICKKFDTWIDTIKDDSVKSLVNKNSIITGGCIASMLLKEPVNDFDVYFTDKQTVKSVANYYVKQWNESNGDNGYILDGDDINVEYTGGVSLNMTPDRIKIIFESTGIAKEYGASEDASDIEEFIPENTQTEDLSKPKFRPIFLSNNAITLSNDIQIVIRFYGDPDNIHQHYDYVHCTNYWLSETRDLTLKQPALESLLAKELRYIGSKYPLASVIRTRKFIKRGWTINAGQYLKMAFQISELDLKDIAVLEDQLTGVDVAYFNHLIQALISHSNNQKDAGKEFKIEYSYLATIIDKIF